MFWLITLQTYAHLTMTVDYHAKTMTLSGTLTKRTDSVPSSGMEVVEAMKIGSRLRHSASNAAWTQVGWGSRIIGCSGFIGFLGTVVISCVLSLSTFISLSSEAQVLLMVGIYIHLCQKNMCTYFMSIKCLADFSKVDNIWHIQLQTKKAYLNILMLHNYHCSVCSCVYFSHLSHLTLLCFFF